MKSDKPHPVDLRSSPLSGSSDDPSSQASHASTMAAPRETNRFATPGRPTVALEPGVVVAERYELVRLLGTGATGAVWEATHRVLTKRVALKFLDGLPADSSKQRLLLERFRYEAQLSARLAESTQHIVAVHDTAVFGDRHYIVMDLASGRSVESLVEQGRVSLQTACTMLHHVGDALRVAHRAGVVHRDVKPANILIVDDGATGEPIFKLADFGVAKSYGTSFDGALLPTRTSSGLSVGSPAYMSPEQVQGMRTVDASPDVWALAVVLYEALTGVLPFDGNSFADLARNIVSGRFTTVRSLVPSLPEGLDEFFARAFAVVKVARYETVEEMVEAFDAAVEADVTLDLVKGRVPSSPALSERASSPPARTGSRPTTSSRPPNPNISTSSVGPATTSVPLTAITSERRVVGGALVLGVLLVLATVMTTLLFIRNGESTSESTTSGVRPEVEDRTQLDLTRTPTAPPERDVTLVTPMPPTRSAQPEASAVQVGSASARPAESAAPAQPGTSTPRPARPVNQSEVY